MRSQLGGDVVDIAFIHLDEVAFSVGLLVREREVHQTSR
jgi:hypothetical protein